MIFMPEIVTQDNAVAVLAQLEAELARDEAGGDIDASRLQRFDSTALSVLLSLRRKAQARGTSGAVRNLPARASQLARLYGLAELLGQPAQAQRTPS
ncbi:MAG: hypothetical protein Fur007_00380 [Rhodoferax sp.]